MVLCGHCIYPILLNLLYNVCISYRYFRKLIIRMMPPTMAVSTASTHKPESSHTIETDPVLFIICFQSFKESRSVFNRIYMLEHTDSTAFGSKPKIPWEIHIRLHNKSVSWQWHCIPITVKSSCRWLSGSVLMATSYPKQAMVQMRQTNLCQASLSTSTERGNVETLSLFLTQTLH